MKKKKVIIPLLVILAIGIILGTRMWFRTENNEPEEMSAGVILDKNAVAYTNQELKEASENAVPGSIRFPGYPDVTVKSSTMEIPIVLANPEGNPCYFQFSVVVEETGEKLLQSDWVEPGKAIEGIALSEPLEAGDYQLVLQISTSALESGTTMNGGNVKTGLHVIA